MFGEISDKSPHASRKGKATMRACLKRGWIVIALCFIFNSAVPASADDNAPAGRVSFYKDILPIMQESCQVCHRPGGKSLSGMVAPMAFMTYQEVRPWSKAIAKQVNAGRMPPWHAAREHEGTFQGERYLADEKVQTLVRWAETGAAIGNPADAPEPVDWDAQSGWAIGEPDLIVKIPKPFFVNDDVEDLQLTFRGMITEEMLPEARYMKASQIISGSEAVHHIIARPLGGMAPGTGPTITPQGFANILRPNTPINWQMHYHKEAGPGTGVWDESYIGVVFHPKGAEKDMKYAVGGGPGNIGNTRFEIPPQHGDWAVGSAHTYAQDTLILSYLPHMHFRGKDITYTAFYPDGTTEILLDVPRYDYNWQNRYVYQEEKWVPEGTRIEVMAHFDNSVDNPYNPDPTRAIRFGGPTTDEMMLGWLSTWLPIEEDDATQ